MCDYSLMGIPNRLAREDEDLVVCEFKTGSLGLTPNAFLNLPSLRVVLRHPWSSLSNLVEVLTAEPVAACVPPGARLLLRDIPEHLQRAWGVGPVEEVTFTQRSATPYQYRDAVRFSNGHEALLQQLSEGQHVRVLRLSLSEELAPHPEFHDLAPHRARVDLLASRALASHETGPRDRHE